ncbi:hypothetical protein H5410_010113 [Solanum commersonii]|uniref:30S ribosomal protein S31, mitochondrial n=1 Tax=Solanum commersonii TaxID=4109 RepID=A0A9J6ALK1_SOLCO|nr:hypothetical protein H5410_010113 [Solanum commersonii]
MAMTQWCSTAAKRLMTVMEQRVSYSSSAAPSAAMGGPILCGRGDKRTKKGKRFKDSYGNSRPKKEKKIERIKDKVEVPRGSFDAKASKRL